VNARMNANPATALSRWMHEMMTEIRMPATASLTANPAKVWAGEAIVGVKVGLSVGFIFLVFVLLW